jgi:hypothetical protein
MFREKSFLEALKVDISAFKECEATVAPAQLQAKTPAQLAEKRKAVQASIIGYSQC